MALKLFLTVGLTALATVVVAAPASAATRVVDDDKVQCPGAPFTQIQAAVTAANPGDTVLVCNGVYPEQVTISKSNLRLIANTVQAAIIQAPPGGASALVRVDGAGVSGVEVSRFVIQGPNASIGLFVGSGASLRMARDNLIRRVERTAISVFGTALDISRNRIQEYELSGIDVGGSGAAAVSLNTLVGGKPATVIGEHSGVVLRVGARGSVIGNRVSGHHTIFDVIGGGIVLEKAASTDVVVKSNQAYDNIRGINVLGTQGALVAGNAVSRNAMEGINVDPASSGNKFDRNDARSNGGTDCSDASMGGGTGGTANTWTFNRGIESTPPGICTP